MVLIVCSGAESAFQCYSRSNIDAARSWRCHQSLPCRTGEF